LSMSVEVVCGSLFYVAQHQRRRSRVFFVVNNRTNRCVPHCSRGRYLGTPGGGALLGRDGTEGGPGSGDTAGRDGGPGAERPPGRGGPGGARRSGQRG
uniref:Uncharacterized protein n=1 Tax=Salarias fasciatus TaxID=181472 RepID=A0A672H3B4_SALFA